MTSLHSRNPESGRRPTNCTNPPAGRTHHRGRMMEGAGLGWGHSRKLSGGGEVEPGPKGRGLGSQQGRWDWAEG